MGGIIIRTASRSGWQEAVSGEVFGTVPPDEYGYHAVEDRMTIHDLHATLLHITGLDHTQLTFEHAGRDYRLTDVYGEAATKILA